MLFAQMMMLGAVGMQMLCARDILSAHFSGVFTLFT
jgi:hypothetical protein